MTKRSVVLVGVLIIMAMIGSSVIGAVSAIAASDTANGSFSVFLPLILNAIGAMAEVPQGAVMTFNLASCPSGWSEVTDAQGRALVGLPSGGTLAGTVGAGLSDGENRAHTHYVDPLLVSSGSVGDHTHPIEELDIDTSGGGSHNHNYDPAPMSTSISSHSHAWAYINDNSNWRTWSYPGLVTREMVNWGDGMDSDGSGKFPIADSVPSIGNRTSYTESNSHLHSIDIPLTQTDESGWHWHNIDLEFDTLGAGGHSHSVDIPTTSSTTASTSDVMPYIQFLVCEKD
jgi:hypothetical protein